MRGTELVIRRSHILEDALAAVGGMGSSVKGPLKVSMQQSTLPPELTSGWPEAVSRLTCVSFAPVGSMQAGTSRCTCSLMVARC